MNQTPTMGLFLPFLIIGRIQSLAEPSIAKKGSQYIEWDQPSFSHNSTMRNNLKNSNKNKKGFFPNRYPAIPGFVTELDGQLDSFSANHLTISLTHFGVIMSPDILL